MLYSDWESGKLPGLPNIVMTSGGKMISLDAKDMAMVVCEKETDSITTL